MEQVIQNIETALAETLSFVNDTKYKTEISAISTMDGKTAQIAPLIQKIQTAANIQTRDTSGDKKYVDNLKKEVGKAAVTLSKKGRVAAKASGNNNLITINNKPAYYYSSATNNLVITRATQLIDTIRPFITTIFKGLINDDDLDAFFKIAQLYDTNKTLPADNRLDKKVNGTQALTKYKKEGIQLLNDIRTLGEGFLPEGSAILSGLLTASDIPEFGTRHTNVHVLVTREDGTLIGKGITAQDLSPTAQASKKKGIYNSNDKSIVPIDEHLPGTTPFLFAAPGCQSKQQDLTFEKGKTVNITIVLKAI